MSNKNKQIIKKINEYCNGEKALFYYFIRINTRLLKMHYRIVKHCPCLASHVCPDIYLMFASAVIILSCLGFTLFCTEYKYDLLGNAHVL